MLHVSTDQSHDSYCAHVVHGDHPTRLLPDVVQHVLAPPQSQATPTKLQMSLLQAQPTVVEAAFAEDDVVLHALLVQEVHVQAYPEEDAVVEATPSGQLPTQLSSSR